LAKKIRKTECRCSSTRAKSAANNWFYSKACRGLPPFYGAPGEFDALADDRLERAVVERFNAVGLTPMPEVIGGIEIWMKAVWSRLALPAR
jgi:hypothetical protein